MADFEIELPAQGPPGFKGEPGVDGEPGDAGPRGPAMGIGWHYVDYDVAGPDVAQFMLYREGTGPVTAILLNQIEITGEIVSAWILSMGDSTNPTMRGHLMTVEANDETRWLMFVVTGTPFEYTAQKWRIPVNFVNGSVDDFDYVPGTHIAFNFSRAGNKGLDGAGGDMFGTNNLSEIADPKAARFNLQISPLQTLGDADVTIANNTKMAMITTALTATRTYTLPSAAAFSPGEDISFLDEFGAVTPTFNAIIHVAGSDTINTGLDHVVLAQRRARLRLTSNGVDHWVYGLDAVGHMIGELIPYAGMMLPPLCVWPDGRNVSRTTYRGLYEATTIRIIGTTANGNTSVTSVAGPADMLEKIKVGMPIEGTGIPAAATIAAYSAGTITLSAAATANGTDAVLRVCPYGVGDGSTTFGICDMRGRTIRARDNLGGSAALRLTTTNSMIGDRVGLGGGDERLVAHTHGNPTSPNGNFVVSAGGTASSGTGAATWGTANKSGAVSGPVNTASGSGNVGPTLVLDYVLFAGI